MTDAEKLKQLIDKLRIGQKLTAAERRFVAAAQRPPEFFKTHDEIALHYGVTRQSVYGWRDFMPDAFVKRPEGYDARKIAEARKKFVAQSKKTNLNAGDMRNANEANGAPAPQSDDEAPPREVFEDAETLKARKMTLECQKMGAQIDILMGLYVKKTTVVRELRAVLYGIKDALMRVPAEVCYSVSGKTPAEAQEIVSESIRRVLTKADEIDFGRFEAALEGEGGVLSGNTRLPAARETNGRQPAPK